MRLGILSTENEDLKKKVHLYKVKVNATTKDVENSDNLHKIASSVLETANKERKAEFPSGELIAEIASLKQ